MNIYNNIYLLIIILALTYILYYIFNKLLLHHYNVKEIVVNTGILSAIILFIIFNKDLYTSIKKNNINYIYLILLAITLVLGNIILTYSCSENINFGIVEGIAMGIYVPIISIISYYFYKNNMSIENFIGIVLIGIGVILTSI